MSCAGSQPLGGESGDVFMDGVALEVVKWTGTEKAKSLDTTNKASNGYVERKGGLKEMTGSVEANWKINKNPGSSPPSMYAGKRVLLKLEIVEAGPFYQFCALLTEIQTENAVDDVVKYQFNFESSGTITRPGETTSQS